VTTAENNMNNWNIPSRLEMEIRNRDLCCIYCGKKFDKRVKKNSATWEHIINDARIITKENIALCCCSCNASKGPKKLSNWLTSEYCKKNSITLKTVAPVVKQALDKPPARM
jgi:hypothetical protein